jgi:hypothetical protein
MRYDPAKNTHTRARRVQTVVLRERKKFIIMSIEQRAKSMERSA